MRAVQFRQQGFTLLEILVAVAIIAIVSGMAVVRFESSDGRRAAQAGEQMAMLLDAARNEAIFSGRSVAISSDGQGYQFWGADGANGEWIVLPRDEMLVAKRLPDGVAWKAQRVNDRPQNIGQRIVFPPDGVIDPFTIELAAGDSVVRLEADVMGRIEVVDASRS